jgi:hypothetical protein
MSVLDTYIRTFFTTIWSLLYCDELPNRLRAVWALTIRARHCSCVDGLGGTSEVRVVERHRWREELVSAQINQAFVQCSSARCGTIIRARTLQVVRVVGSIHKEAEQVPTVGGHKPKEKERVQQRCTRYRNDHKF